MKKVFCLVVVILAISFLFGSSCKMRRYDPPKAPKKLFEKENYKKVKSSNSTGNPVLFLRNNSN